MNINETMCKAMKSAFIEVAAKMYRVNYYIHEEEESYIELLDEDSGNEYIYTFEELQNPELKVKFYQLTEI